MTTQDIKEIPPEKLGFEGFILNYAWNSNISERNKYILSIFPSDLWEKVDISIDDANKYADVIFQNEGMLGKTVAEKIKENNDKYLEEIAQRLYAAFHIMKMATIWNEGLMKDENFKNKCAEIARAELQLLGLKMFSTLSLENKKKFLDQVSTSAMPPYALRLWADYAFTPLSENEFFEKNEKKTFPRTHLSDVIGKIGFIATIAWLRELPNYRNFENLASATSEFVLDSEKLKSYAMFDSAFFPYMNK